MHDDREHLRRFAATRDEAAFAAIVNRYGAPVLSICRRQLGDRQLAEDATQAVFLVLAQRAVKLSAKENIVLSGWLFQTARYACANVQRTERRRLHHERRLAAMTSHDARGLTPTLDDAIASLRTSDRDLVLLRYMNGISTADVSRQLRMTESTVRKRLSRAVARLRDYFVARGLSPSDASVIACLDLFADDVLAPQFAQHVVAACTSSGIAPSASSVSIAKGIVNMMQFNTFKLVSSVAAALVLLGGATAFTVNAQQSDSRPQPSPDAAIPVVAVDRDDLLKQSQEAANNGGWKEAIDLYSQYLRQLSVDEYRDKKDFSWIHRQYDHQEQDDHALLIKVLTELFKERGPEDPDFWRLNRLAAEIAEERGAREPRRQHLLEAIKSYPGEAAVQGNPWQHSSLQHLYNEVAMMMAADDLEAGENYLVESFENDPRYVYPFLFPWREFYAKLNKPERLEVLAGRISELYPRKLETDAANRRQIERCRAEYERALPGLIKKR